MSKIKLLILLLTSLFFSCSYNTIEEEKENLPTPKIIDNGGIEATVTYTNYTKKIIDDNCISCHSPIGLNVAPQLTTYTQVRTIANNGRLKARAIDELPTRMPPIGSLPQTVKDTLQLWINQGTAE
jgi:cytochrome c5